jgi:hypothetical protein
MNAVLRYIVYIVYAHDRVPFDGVVMSTKQSKTLGKPARLPQSEGETRQLICRLIADYCNGTDIEEIKFLAKMLLLAHRGTKALASTPEHIKDVAVDAQALRDFVEEGGKFRAAAEWLCSPKPHRPGAEEPPGFKISAKRLIRIGNDMEANGSFPGKEHFLKSVDLSNESFCDYFEQHAVQHIRRHIGCENGKLALYSSPLHLIDLLCVVLLDECFGKEPSEMPIKLCPRCQTFFSACELEGEARVRKNYCSTKCQRGAFWTAERRADYRYLERLEIYDDLPHEIRKRMEKSKVQQRLRNIEARWPDWKKIQDRLTALRTKARLG